MKKLIFACSILLLSVTVQSQEINYKDLATVTKRGKYTSYVSKSGFVYKVGDKVKIGFPSSNKTFAFITEGDGIVIPITQLDAARSGDQTEIKSIWVNGSKRIGWSVGLWTKGLSGLANYGIQIENALESGEVKSSVMSSDEALAELKKAKDKLDLGLITQDEYDKLKSKLALIIR